MKKIIIFLCVAFAFALSCTTQKRITTDTVTVDSGSVKVVDSLSLEITKIKSEYEKLKTEAKKTEIVFEQVPCPDVQIDSTCTEDSLIKLIRQQEKYIRSLKNTVKVNADGSYELQGQVKSFQISLDKVEKETNNLYVENVNLKRVKDSLATELVKSQTKTDRKVKRSFLNWWIFLVAGFVAGYAVRSKIKLLGVI